MRKKTRPLLLLCALLLAACGGDASSVSSAPPSRPPAVSSSSLSAPPSPLPPLSAPEAPPPAAEPESWWIGTETDEQNRPLHCVQLQEQYGTLGFTALGPEAGSVYLSFDFGYETGYSGQILDTLAEKDAKATFFLVRDYIQNETATLRRMVREGHSIGSHSTTHPGGPGGVPALPPAARQEEITASGVLLAEAYGYPCRLFRFPEGIYSPACLAQAAQLGYYSVFWSYAYTDWDAAAQPEPAAALQKALDAAHPGAIYLLHPQQTNAEILGALIDGLRARGYEPAAL